MTNLQNETSLDKGAYEFQWARQLARRGLTSVEHKIWQSYRSVDRLALKLHSTFVHWGWHDGKSIVFKQFKLADVKVQYEGVSYTLSDNSGSFYKVTHTPSLLGNTGICAWVPHFNEFRHVPVDWENAKEPGYLRVSICVWQPSNPLKVRLQGHSYITTKQVFERDWAFETISKGQTDA